MASGQAAPRREPPFVDPPGYARHRPEETLLLLVNPFTPLAARVNDRQRLDPRESPSRSTAGCAMTRRW